MSSFGNHCLSYETMCPHEDAGSQRDRYDYIMLLLIGNNR